MSALRRKPRVFISAVTGELEIYRLSAEQWLRKHGYTPITMDDLGTVPNSVEIRDKILAKLRSCQAAVCLIGDCYGCPLPLQDGESPQSYTQFEYFTAKKLGLTVYAFLTDEGIQKAELVEPPELRELQREFRQKIQFNSKSYDSFSKKGELHNHLAELQQLPHPLSPWRIVAALLLACAFVAFVVWWFGFNQGKQPEGSTQAKENKERERPIPKQSDPLHPKTAPPEWRAVKLDKDRILIDGINVTDAFEEIREEILGTKRYLTDHEKVALNAARREQPLKAGVLYFATVPFNPRAPIEGVDLNLPIRAWVGVLGCVAFQNGPQTRWGVVSNGWERDFVHTPSRPRFLVPPGDFVGSARLVVCVYPHDNDALAALSAPPTTEQLSIVYREP
jgi:Domain of unknown function (DUF4062)